MGNGNRIECEGRQDAQERLANARRMGYPAEVREEAGVWVLYLRGAPKGSM